MTLRLDILVKRLNNLKNKSGSFKSKMTDMDEADILKHLKDYEHFIEQRVDISGVQKYYGIGNGSKKPDAAAELFKLLKNHTAPQGNYALYVNEHKSFYETVNGFDGYDAAELKGLDKSKDIYKLQWYSLSPGGFYGIYGNSIEEIAQQVKDLIINERLSEYGDAD